MPAPNSIGGPVNGVSSGYTGHNENILRAMIAFTAIALYNAVELLVLIFLVFKKYRGLYFWSMLVCSLSIIPNALGAWMKQINLTSITYLPVSLSTFGWMFMVTSQSLVLYSRLHLVSDNRLMLRGLLVLIVVDAILLYPPTAVLTFGSQTMANFDYAWGYEVMEKIQMTIFTVQEFLISAIYLWEVYKLLSFVYEGGTLKLMWELAAINVAIIVLGVALLTIEYLNYYEIETTLKGMAYSIKLKLEFGVLSKLVKIVNGPVNHGSAALMNAELGFDSLDADDEKAADLTPIASFSLSSFVPSSRTGSSKLPSPSSASKYSKSSNGSPILPELAEAASANVTSWASATVNSARGLDARERSMFEAADSSGIDLSVRRFSFDNMYPGRLDPNT